MKTRTRCACAGRRPPSAATAVQARLLAAVLLAAAARTAPAAAIRIDLVWTDNSSNEDGFKVDRRQSGGDTWVRVGQLGTDVTTFSDTDLPPETKFYYKVKAFNSAGNSPYSNVADATTPAAASGFTAYNDLAGSTGQLNTRITTYTRGQSGPLVDYDTANAVPVTLRVGSGGAGPYLTQGADAGAGTDADAVFGGKVDCAGVISYSDDSLTLTFTGMSTNLLYDVVVFGNRHAASYTDRITKIAIRDMAYFRNTSTAGTRFAGEADPSTAIVNGYNTGTGYVGRFTDVEPGPDGDVVIEIYDNESPQRPKFYANAVRLRAYQGTPGSASDPDAGARADSDGDGMSDAWETQHGLSASDTSDADADTDGDGCSNWAESVAGTDPTDPNSRLEVGPASIEAGQFQLAFDTVAGRQYVVEYADSLPAVQWTELTRLTGDGQPAAARDAGVAPMRIYRLRVLE
ncbi:MAG: fibronectin type III domain-containing protein [Kiritimatiellae bacterium]|nr:fibronectin type III domain-containing protein [Kiritimatiellia bacterium]